VVGVAIAASVAIAACGSFDSSASGKNLITDYVKQYGGGKVSVKSVKCPSGVKEQVGHSFNCDVTLHDSSDNTNQSGQITIHMVAGNKVEIDGRQDLHF
jgi:Domain of unknown function (DUF4333)